MFEDFALIGGVLIKYGIMLFFVAFSIALLHSFLTKLRARNARKAYLRHVDPTCNGDFSAIFHPAQSNRNPVLVKSNSRIRNLRLRD